MRAPDFIIDGWCLDDGEECHRTSPKTFWIPPLEHRKFLQKGDLAKLIFRISLDNAEEPVAVERMWVIVRERIAGGYFGVLDNDPTSISENSDFWSGAELPFEYRHIIGIGPGNEKTIIIADTDPIIPWQGK